MISQECMFVNVSALWKYSWVALLRLHLSGEFLRFIFQYSFESSLSFLYAVKLKNLLWLLHSFFEFGFYYICINVLALDLFIHVMVASTTIFPAWQFPFGRQSSFLLHFCSFEHGQFWYLLTYLIGLIPCYTILAGRFFAIISASFQALRFGVGSFDNLKDFKLQLTRCCQVFLGRLRFCLPVKRNQPSLRQTWPNQVKGLFVMLCSGSLSIVYVIDYQMIFYHWSLLCISSDIWTSAVARAQHSLLYNATLQMQLS